MMKQSNVVEIKDLSFSYSKKSKTILDNISLKVPKGAIYGFLGVNGAGKSTTMQLLTGSLMSTNGNIHLFEKPLESQLPSVFKRIGCLIESPSLYYHLSGYDNLLYVAKMKGISIDVIPEVLDLVGLSENANKKVKKYSTGMRQRLAIGFTLLGNPELLLLDEPINGLDPQGIIDVRKLLIKLNKERGITIFISSHLLDEIERICTHIGVLNKGKLVFDDTIDLLKEKSNKTHKLIVELKESNFWYNKLKKTYPSIIIKENTISYEAEKKKDADNFLLTLIQSGADIIELKTKEDFEDLFLNLSK